MGVVGTGVAVRERAVVVAGAAPGEPKAPLTRFHQRIAAELLTARSGHGASRLAPALAQSAVDLNPHQIEAAAFALASLPYIATVVVLALISRDQRALRRNAPASLGQPYFGM